MEAAEIAGRKRNFKLKRGEIPKFFYRNFSNFVEFNPFLSQVFQVLNRPGGVELTTLNNFWKYFVNIFEIDRLQKVN